jgi:hypothetical protein
VDQELRKQTPTQDEARAIQCASSVIENKDAGTRGEVGKMIVGWELRGMSAFVGGREACTLARIIMVKCLVLTNGRKDPES